MQVNLSGHHVELTPALRQYVEEKLLRVERYHDQITQAYVVLDVEKLRHKAEVTLKVPHSDDIHAQAEEADMYAAIDAMADKLDRQIKRHKEKLTDHRRDEKPRIYEA